MVSYSKCLYFLWYELIWQGGHPADSAIVVWVVSETLNNFLWGNSIPSDLGRKLDFSSSPQKETPLAFSIKFPPRNCCRNISSTIFGRAYKRYNRIAASGFKNECLYNTFRNRSRNKLVSKTMRKGLAGNTFLKEIGKLFNSPDLFQSWPFIHMSMFSRSNLHGSALSVAAVVPQWKRSGPPVCLLSNFHGN